MNRHSLTATLGVALEVLGIGSYFFLFDRHFLLFLPAIVFNVLYFLSFGSPPRWGLNRRWESFFLSLLMGGACLYFAYTQDYFVAAGLYLAYAQCSHRMTLVKSGYQGVLWSFLSIIMAARFATELVFFGYLLLYLFCLFLYLNRLEIAGSLDKPWHPSGKTLRSITPAGFAGWFMLLFVVSAATFFFTPRIQIRSHIQPRTTEKEIGFSEMTDLSHVGKLNQTGELVLRLDSPKPFLLRGFIYDQFNGKTWKTSTRQKGLQYFNNKSHGFIKKARAQGNVYEVTLTRIKNISRILFAPANLYRLEAEAGIFLQDNLGTLYPDAGANMNREFHFICGDDVHINPKDERLLRDFHYNRMKNFLDTTGLSRNAERLTHKIVKDQTGILPKMTALRNYLQSNYEYTLDVTTSKENPLDHFLFESRKGHCEFFATALALMLRHQGIPTRYVTGFVPHERNHKGESYFILQDDAHAWVEVFFPHYGWVAVDATPESSQARLVRNNTSGWWQNIKLQWYYHVISYSKDHQVQLTRESSQLMNQTWKNIEDRWQQGKVPIGKLAFLILVLFSLGSILHRELFQKRSPQQKALARLKSKVAFYHRYEKILKKKGCTRYPGETPLQFRERIQTGKTALHHQTIVNTYYKVRFGGASLNKDDKQQIHEALHQLKELPTRH